MEKISVNWIDGLETINVDFARLGMNESPITETYQVVSSIPLRYNTTSEIQDRGNGRFALRLFYVKEDNQDIVDLNLYWGHLDLELYPGVSEGTAHWTADEKSDWSGPIQFTVEGAPDDFDREGRLGEGETESETITKVRRKQRIFRANVLEVETCCRVTGVENPEFLNASHMKPWIDSDHREKVSGCNGLMLTPSIDRLFDRHFISFEDSGKLLVSKRLPPEVLEALITFGKVKEKAFYPQQLKFIAYHRERFYKKQVDA
jgi:hypothetical protein